MLSESLIQLQQQQQNCRTETKDTEINENLPSKSSLSKINYITHNCM